MTSIGNGQMMFYVVGRNARDVVYITELAIIVACKNVSKDIFKEFYLCASKAGSYFSTISTVKDFRCSFALITNKTLLRIAFYPIPSGSIHYRRVKNTTHTRGQQGAVFTLRNATQQNVQHSI